MLELHEGYNGIFKAKNVDDLIDNLEYRNKFEKLLKERLSNIMKDSTLSNGIVYLDCEDPVPAEVIDGGFCEKIGHRIDIIHIYLYRNRPYVVACVNSAFNRFKDILEICESGIDGSILFPKSKNKVIKINNIESSNIGYVFRVIPVFEDYDQGTKFISDFIDNNPELYSPDIEMHYIERETPSIKVRYHKELCPELIEMDKNPKGDFIDLRSAENVKMTQGEYKNISLGISVQLPKGYHAEIVPRSSTYRNFGIIMSGSIGIIDESYCGDNDIWHFTAIALKDTEINVNDRICQFRIVRNRDINIEIVDKLYNEDRGGIGSTGKN